MNKIVHFESNNALNFALLTTWQIHTQEWFPDKSLVMINEGTWQVHKQEWFPDKSFAMINEEGQSISNAENSNI